MLQKYPYYYLISFYYNFNMKNTGNISVKRRILGNILNIVIKREYGFLCEKPLKIKK